MQTCTLSFFFGKCFKKFGLIRFKVNNAFGKPLLPVHLDQNLGSISSKLPLALPTIKSIDPGQKPSPNETQSLTSSFEQVSLV